MDIAYQVVGEGATTLVFVPGFVSNVETVWESPEGAAFFSRLASFCRLLLFDKRGTGLSDRVPVDRLPSLEERMDDVRAVMDAAGCERAALFGLSEGGPMSVLFAATYPTRVTQLILYGSYARRVDAEPMSDEAQLRFIEESWGTGAVLGARSASRVDDPAAREALARMERQAATPSAAAAMIRMAFAIDVSGILGAVAVPSLVMHRTGDPVLRVEAGRALAKGIPTARYVEFEGVDHIPWFGNSNVILDEIEEFVTGTLRSVTVDRVLATVLFTDIVASTERAAQMGDAAWRSMLDRHDAIAAREVERWRGRQVKSTGDGILATFDGPARGIRCAIALRAELEALDIRIRVGLHTGEIELRGADVGGIGVHIGARVCALAGDGEVLVSRTVTELVAGSGISFADRGEHTLKGVPGAWNLFAVSGP